MLQSKLLGSSSQGQLRNSVGSRGPAELQGSNHASTGKQLHAPQTMQTISIKTKSGLLNHLPSPTLVREEQSSRTSHYAAKHKAPSLSRNSVERGSGKESSVLQQQRAGSRLNSQQSNQGGSSRPR